MEHFEPSGTIRVETPTEETRASAVATQFGGWLSGPDLQSQPPPVEVRRPPEAAALCFSPRAWKTESSRSGTF